jgi:hypothetical protein
MLDPQPNGRQESTAEVSSESKRAVALRHFSHKPCRIFQGRRGPAGECGARPRPETRRESYGESEGGEREGGSSWKSGGGRTRLYTWLRVGLADKASSDAIPEARAVS